MQIISTTYIVTIKLKSNKQRLKFNYSYDLMTPYEYCDQYVLFVEHDKHANGLAAIYPLVL